VCRAADGGEGRRQRRPASEGESAGQRVDRQRDRRADQEPEEERRGLDPTTSKAVESGNDLIERGRNQRRHRLAVGREAEGIALGNRALFENGLHHPEMKGTIEVEVGAALTPDRFPPKPDAEAEDDREDEDFDCSCP
jgi:hypothetical protein